MQKLWTRDLDDVSLGEFVKIFIANVQKKCSVVPYHSDPVWHNFFYKLKHNQENKPKCISELRFDWDSPYPKEKELSDYLFAIECMSGSILTYRDSLGTLYPEDIIGIWLGIYNNLDDKGKTYITKAVERFAELL